MKRFFKNLLISALACMMIAGSALSTAAYSRERVIYFGGNCNTACDTDTQDSGCPESSADLYRLLRQCGLSEELCRRLCGLTGSCDNTWNNSCEDNTCAPTEEVTEEEQEPTTPAEAVITVPTEAPVKPTEAPIKPTETPVKPTEAPLKPTEPPTVPTTDDGLSEYEREVVRLVNGIRRQYGLGELTVNTALSRVARLKSQDMLEKRYFSHTSPTYGSPFDMMTRFGIRYRTAGENIAMGYRTPQSVVDGWMNSEGHRRNILNAGFTQIGMGYVANGNYWTQMFIG